MFVGVTPRSMVIYIYSSSMIHPDQSPNSGSLSRVLSLDTTWDTIPSKDIQIFAHSFTVANPSISIFFGGEIGRSPKEAHVEMEETGSNQDPEATLSAAPPSHLPMVASESNLSPAVYLTPQRR